MKTEEGLNKLVSGRLSTYAAIILMFTYSILLDRDFACTCEDQVFDCGLYLWLPTFIILLLILWTDSSFQGVIKHLCSSCSSTCCHAGHGTFSNSDTDSDAGSDTGSNAGSDTDSNAGSNTSQDTCCSTCSRLFMCSLIRDIFKAFLVGLLWIAFVLLDGDWFVCCMNDHSPLEQPLACKDKANTTERERVMIAELKNKSRVGGGFFLMAILLVGSVAPLLERSKCLKSCRDSCCNRKFLYSKLILEEQELALEQILRDSAKEDLTNKIQEKIRCGQWEESFEVAAELIKNSEPHVMGGASEAQRRPDEEEEPGTSRSSS